MRTRSKKKWLSSGSSLIWFVPGLGLVERKELEEMLGWSRTIGGGVVLVPPYHESDLPVGSVPDMAPEVEEAALACLVEGLFKHLKGTGKFRKIEQALPEIEKVMASARAVMTEEISK